MSSLSHHGIKGQKWGVRRFQNKERSTTGPKAAPNKPHAFSTMLIILLAQLEPLAAMKE